ncbi:LuxR family transcriptional regulator [Aurantiacibacter xanthus]|uniref:LuxR family transcriptional regulator n=1 Tax=Aurantiacibacter xanthus TaxID=1784712 RepID=A0A3A1NY45_9SPHN|nr:LuxR family transcriptional regulator [Aurantiacibacter xanthus]RIV79909.1 LuxR family transcriptional regulator [Aurantiacibacter xanthus]
MKALEDRIAQVLTADTAEEAFARFNAAMLDYGYDSNVYTLLTDHPSLGLSSTHGLAASYPAEWLDHYKANIYQKVDPVWQRLLESPTPFFWGDAVDRLAFASGVAEETKAAALRVMNEAAEAGVADGIGISYVNSRGEMAAVGLSRSREVKERRYETMAEVFLIATFFHEKYRSFLSRAPVPHLTDRELEVLLWACDNKTDAEIGDLLGITARAIRYHWSNIFRKLGVHGRVRAVVMAIQLNLICPQGIRPPCQG